MKRWAGVAGTLLAVTALAAAAFGLPGRSGAHPLADGEPVATAGAPVPGSRSAQSEGTVAKPSTTARPRNRSAGPPTKSSLPQLGRANPNGLPVFVLGDSLTVGAEPWLAGAVGPRGWYPTVDARVSRTTQEGLRILARKEADLPATILVALGTNDLQASDAEVRSWLRDLRSIAGEKRRLLWVNLDVAESHPSYVRSQRINAVLARSAANYEIEVADWEQWAGDRGVTHRPDGIHYDERNYRRRAAFYAEALGEVRGSKSRTRSSSGETSTSTTSSTLLSAPEVPS